MSLKIAVLGSGSSGNATLVASGKTRILIDGGFSARELAARIRAVGEEPERIQAIVVTHEHTDHIQGVRVFAKRHRVPVFMTGPSWEASPLSAPAKRVPATLFEPGRALEFGPLRLWPFTIPHDAAQCVGFRIEAEGMVVGHVTDLGETTALLEERIAACDALVLESNHDTDMLRIGPYPWSLKQRIAGRGGHLSNDACARLIERVLHERTRAVVLAHLSETNNHPEIALLTSRSALARNGRGAPRLSHAHQDRPAEVIEL